MCTISVTALLGPSLVKYYMLIFYSVLYTFTILSTVSDTNETSKGVDDRAMNMDTALGSIFRIQLFLPKTRNILP